MALELSYPMDTYSEPTGNIFINLSEIYESEAGVADHFKQAMESWDDFQDFVDWIGRCKIKGVPVAPTSNSLW